MKVKWVRVNKGSKDEPIVRCRLVAQELGYGERIDELFAGTPSMSSVRLVLHHSLEVDCNRRLMLLDVKCAFLYGVMSRRVYIELPRQDPRSGSGAVGLLQKAMYGTRDAPQIWQNEVRNTMEEFGFMVSALQPSMYYHPERGILVTVHVDDFLCSGRVEDLEWLYAGLKGKYDLTKTLFGEGHSSEAKYLNRRLYSEGKFISMEGDPKHLDLLIREWALEHGRGVDTPVTREGLDKICMGEELDMASATKVRRSIARINFMSQDRPDLAVAARIASQWMSSPREGILPFIKRVIRYLLKFPKVSNFIQEQAHPQCLHVWTDSDWAGDQSSRRSCSGGYVQLDGTTLTHWSKLQSNVALSSGEAELNATVKGLSEAIGIWELVHEVTGRQLGIKLYVDSSACKGIVLRHGAGKVKHLTTKQLWVQGAVRTYGVEVIKVPRERNAADVLTHDVAKSSMMAGLEAMGYWENGKRGE